MGIIGDFAPSNPTHQFTNEALLHARMDAAWIPTESVSDDPAGLICFDGIWIAPGSPYRIMDGALNAIRYARERGVLLAGA